MSKMNGREIASAANALNDGMQDFPITKKVATLTTALAALTNKHGLEPRDITALYESLLPVVTWE